MAIKLQTDFILPSNEDSVSAESTKDKVSAAQNSLKNTRNSSMTTITAAMQKKV
jgi:hypothetical protein